MKKLVLFITLMLAWTFNGCDVIDENSRILEMDEIIPLKNVLLADFTDQDCINCPNAAVVIEKLRESYKDALIVVSIHASTRNRPLVTNEGNIYDQHFKTNETGHPAGVIDGTQVSINYEQWGGLIRQRFDVESKLNLQLSTAYNPANRQLEITSKVRGSRRFSQIHLLLWAIEDQVVSWQKMPDNSTNANYVHNHLFRAAVNGVWGETFSLDAEEEKELKNNYTLDEKWIADNTSIVGFVFDAATNEVFDVKKINLK